jgi:hypothetical protein
VGAAIQYGAWIVEQGNERRYLVTIAEDDFRRELKLALLDNGADVDAALEKVRQMLVRRVREALA